MNPVFAARFAPCRGRDFVGWMQASGVLDERYDEIEDIVRRV